MTAATTHRVAIVGGGPAGMMCALLLARAGVKVTVLEKHRDFLRDFRGDTVHPSTLDLFAQLGWLDDLLALPHSRIEEVAIRIAGGRYRIASLRGLPVAASFIAMIPQWDLLDFMAGKARRYPGFTLRMGCEATGLQWDAAGRAQAVRLSGGSLLPATLVIAADGRRSVLREAAELPLHRIGAPMDVLWFRLDKPAGTVVEETFGILEAGRFMVMIDRRDYYQCAFVIPKGRIEAIRRHGLEDFRAGLRQLAPQLAPSIARLADWDQIKLLEVSVDRLTCWHRPGLLAIGDAAHAMSPVGGVGINLAVQDAVAAANLLAAPLARGGDPDPLLPLVRQRRWRAVTRMQAVQRFAQDRIIAPTLEREAPITRAPLPVRLLDAVAPLRRIPGRIIGLGFDRQRIESPDAHA